MKAFIKAGVVMLMSVLAYPGSHAGPGTGGDFGEDSFPPGGNGDQITYYLTGSVTIDGVANKTYGALSSKQKLGILEGGKKANASSPELPATFKTDANGYYKVDWKAGPFTGTVGSTINRTLDFRIKVKDAMLSSKKYSGTETYTYSGNDLILEAGKTEYPVGGQEVIVLVDDGGGLPPH